MRGLGMASQPTRALGCLRAGVPCAYSERIALPCSSVPQPTLVSSTPEALPWAAAREARTWAREYEQRCKLHGTLPALR